MAKKQKDQKQPATARDYTVVLRPRITEKSSFVGGEGSVVVFEVARKASKEEIQKAIERIFSVDVEAVRTANYLGKVRRRGMDVGRTAAYKKAYITLKPGQTIDVVEGL